MLSRSYIFVAGVGSHGMNLLRILISVYTLPKRFSLFIAQMYAVGVLTVVIILISGLFVGMVLALQGYHTLSKYNSENAVGILVLLSLSRELGPVITALLFAGRSGSAMTAEIALMKATEQISSIEIMGVNPYHYIYGPRFFAAWLSLPLLTILFIIVGLWGGFFVSSVLLGVDPGIFWSSLRANFDFNHDLINGIIKSAVFGFTCSWISITMGINSVPTADGMSNATTKTVVASSLAVLGLDYVLTSLMFTGN